MNIILIQTKYIIIVFCIKKYSQINQKHGN